MTLTSRRLPSLTVKIFTCIFKFFFFVFSAPPVGQYFGFRPLISRESYVGEGNRRARKVLGGHGAVRSIGLSWALELVCQFRFRVSEVVREDASEWYAGSAHLC